MAEDLNAVIARYEAGVELFAEAVRDLPAEIIDRAPAPGKWSIRQIALHLADSEIMGAARLRTIAAQPGALMKAYDQDAWARELRYVGGSIEEAVELFRALRRSTAAMLRRLPASAWDNKAVHEESGEASLRAFVPHYAEHAEHHSAQIRELRAAFARRASA